MYRFTKIPINIVLIEDQKKIAQGVRCYWLTITYFLYLTSFIDNFNTKFTTF